MQLRTFSYDMQLRYPFAISRHTYYSQPSVIVELSHEGFTGYGEATSNPYYNITTENLLQNFATMSKRLEHYHFTTPDKLFADFEDYLTENPFALGALNNASWDLFGKLNDCQTQELISLDRKKEPLTSYTLGIDSKENMLKKLGDLPWPIYKIKLGTPDDLELVEHIRANTDSVLRIDANCAWDAEQTVSLSSKLEKLSVEFIEQPLPKGDPGQEQCFRKSHLPIMADESCRVERDVQECSKGFHAINIKLLKCGGLSPAIRMIQNARDLGLNIMIGCMTESSIGMAAAAQLLPFVDYADLDGPLLLAEDVADGLSYDAGAMRLSDENGLGIAFTGKK